MSRKWKALLIIIAVIVVGRFAAQQYFGDLGPLWDREWYRIRRTYFNWKFRWHDRHDNPYCPKGISALDAGENIYCLVDTRLSRISVLKSEAMLELDNLMLMGEISRNEIRYIADNKNLVNLKHLHIDTSSIEKSGVLQIIDSQYLENVEELSLDQAAYFDPDDVRALVNSPMSSNLKILKINLKDEEAFEILAKSPSLASLEKLAVDTYLGIGSFVPILDSKHLANLVDISIECDGGNRDPGIASLLETRNIGNLKSLRIEDYRLPTEVAVAIANCPKLKHLESLELIGDIKTAGAVAIANSEYMSNLKKLDLYSNEIGPEGAAAIAESPYLKDLEHLDLESNKIGWQGMQTIIDAPGFHKLGYLKPEANKICEEKTGWETGQEMCPGSLRLSNQDCISWCVLENSDSMRGRMKQSHNDPLKAGYMHLVKNLSTHRELTPEDAATIAGSEHFSNLVALRIRGRIGTSGAQAIAQSPFLRKLKHLQISGDGRGERIGAEGVSALANSRNLAGLETLAIWFETIGAEGAKAIAESPYLTNLKRLDLVHCNITDEGVRILSNSPNLSGVRYINLGGSKMTDTGFAALVHSPYLDQLISLDVSGNKITEIGARELAASALFKNLRAIDLEYNNISKSGLQALIDAEGRKNLCIVKLQNDITRLKTENK